MSSKTHERESLFGRVFVALYGLGMTGLLVSLGFQHFQQFSQWPLRVVIGPMITLAMAVIGPVWMKRLAQAQDSAYEETEANSPAK